jgi:hypothetical protein
LTKEPFVSGIVNPMQCETKKRFCNYFTFRSLDKSGILKYVHYCKSMADIPDISEIEKVLKVI